MRLDRFLVAIDTGCWIWTGHVDRRGYARGSAGATMHRRFYEEFVGPIPDGLEIDHLCRVPTCVNPDHLEPVTHNENIRRRYEIYTTCRRGHSLTDDANVRIRNGIRNCRACDVIRQRESKQRRSQRSEAS